MALRTLIRHGINRLLRPLDLEMSRRRSSTERPWDEIFRGWIARARELGVDPNDLGDREWEDDRLQEALDHRYLPHIRPGATILELGPGTGRLSRHLAGRAQEMILVDYSAAVCEWLEEYLGGRGGCRIVHIDRPVLTGVADASVDAVVAHGVFEHIDFDDLICFLEEFARVLRPGGVASFNFDSPMSEGGLRWFRRWRGAPGERCIFRFHHPEVVARACHSAGLRVLRMTTDDTRFAHVEAVKPGEAAPEGPQSAIAAARPALNSGRPAM